MNVLIVEDSPDDCALLVRHLRQGGYDLSYERVDRPEDLRAALTRRQWDIVLSDYDLPGFTGIEALRILGETGLDIPLIIVSGVIDDEMAVEAMRSGASDYVRKDNMRRLIPAIERELREARVRQERRRTEEQYRQSEEKFRLLVESAPDAVFVQTDGNLAYVNPAAVRLFGAKSASQLLGRPLLELVAPEYRPLMSRRIRQLNEERREVPLVVQKYLRLDGTAVFVEGSAVPFVYNGQRGSLSFLRDITARIRTEDELRRSREKLRLAVEATVQAIARMVETRDPYTAGHQRRVADLACAVAVAAGVDAGTIDGIRLAGMIHDIGKISVPAEILGKPVGLTEIEMKLIRLHPQAGYDILKEIEFPWPIDRIVLEHHERCDGSGYPQGLKGDEISLEARILAVADVVEAMASHRPYRPGLGLEEAFAEIRENSGRLYDERVVAACLKVFAEGYTLPTLTA